MIDPTRREFLAAAGGAIASATIVGAGHARARHVRASPERARSEFDSRRIAPLAVEGIHAYTDRVSVAGGRDDSLSCEQLVSLRAPSLPARDRRRTQSIATRSCIRSARSARGLQPIHPGSYLHVEKRLDHRDRARGLDARDLGQALAHHGPPGDHQPVRRAESVRLRLVRQRRRLARLLCRRRRRVSRAEFAHDRSRSAQDGDQSPGPEDPVRTTRRARCFRTSGITSSRC